LLFDARIGNATKVRGRKVINLIHNRGEERILNWGGKTNSQLEGKMLASTIIRTIERRKKRKSQHSEFLWGPVVMGGGGAAESWSGITMIHQK